jgi:hypothetical protein
LVESLTVTGNVIVNDIPGGSARGQHRVAVGKITGMIKDASGKAIAEALVAVTNAGTGEQIQATTGSKGEFLIPSIMAGDHVMSARAAGFGSLALPIKVRPDETAVQDIQLGKGTPTDLGLSTLATAQLARIALWVVPGGRDFSRQEPVNYFTVTGNTMTGLSNLRLWVRNEWQSRLPPGLNELLTWEFFNTEN